MQKIKKTINKLFPYLILTTLFFIPFQIRKVLFPVFESGYFHETLSMSIYLSDILIILCITCGLGVYYYDILEYLKKKWENVKSKFSRKFPLSKKHPLTQSLLISPSERGSLLSKDGQIQRKRDIKNPLFWLTLFILWQCVTLFRANNIGIAIFRIFKIIEMTLFGTILYFFFAEFRICPPPLNPLLREEEKYKPSCFLFLVSCFLMLSGTIQSLWAILQFIFQKSLGLTFLKESVLSPAIPGVAKIIIGGQKYIRAYGGLPHPNILAGFLVISIVCTKLTLLSCKSYTRPLRYANIIDWLNQNNSIQKENFNDKNLILKRFGQAKLTLVSCSIYTKVTLILKISLFLQLIALILTGSISGFLALLVFGVISFSRRDDAMPRLYNEDNQKLTLVSCNHYTKLTLVLCFLIFLGGGLFYLRSGDLIQNGNSISERLEQYKISKEILSENKNIIFGVGAGNYVDYLRQVHLPLTPLPEMLRITMQAGSSDPLRQSFSEARRRGYYPWQKQPVHNVFALILVENGGIGLLLFLIFFSLLVWQNPVVISLLPILCFDHYLWTMQQGMCIMFLSITFLLFFKKLENESVFKMKEIRN